MAPIAAGPRPARSSAVRAPRAPTPMPAEHKRAELGAVTCAVVGGERAAAHRLGSALVDQRAEQHVLDSVRDAAE